MNHRPNSTNEFSRLIDRATSQLPESRLSDQRQPPQCDVATAVRRLAGYTDVYSSLVANLMTDRMGSLRELQIAVQQNDAVATMKAAHAIKGLALTCGANGIAAAAAELEQMGRSAQMNQSALTLSALIDAFQVASQELAPYWTDNDAPTIEKLATTNLRSGA